MTTGLLFSFLFAIAILTLTPGFDTVLVLRTAAAQGWRRACFTALGVNLGCLLWGIAVGCGLGALLLASEMAYSVLKWLGAAYLFYLGVKFLLSPRQTIADASTHSEARQSSWRCLTRGLYGNLLNPKVGVFYVTFMPQFIPADASVPLWCIMMTLAHVAIGLLWNGVLIAASHSFSACLRRPRVLQVMDRLSGLIFIGFAAKLALSRR